MRVVVKPDGTLAVQDGGQRGAYRATGTPDSPYTPIYGQTGLFGVCGVHPTLFNATVGPIGVEKILTWRSSREVSPIYRALTYIGSSGYSQDGSCGDCGTPEFKVCHQSACFGRVCQGTFEHAIDDIGMVMNQGVPRAALFGNITDPAGNVLLAQGQEITDAFTMELIGAAYNLRSRLAWMNWNGDPANSAGGYVEFPGLDRIINTGKRDELSGLLCEALDSYVRSYGNAVIGAAGAPSIVATIAGAIRTVRYRIQGMNKDPEAADIFIALHPRLWDQVAAAWACEYGLACRDEDATTYNNALELAQMRDDFMSNLYLTVDGRRYPVVLDNVMASSVGYLGDDTIYCGEIAILTRSLEGETILWGEYQNIEETASQVLAWFRSMFGTQPWAVTDGGRFFYAYDVEGGLCFDAKVLAKTRILCTMPQLQARITNVCALPLGTYPDYTGSGGIYEVEGGASTTPYLGMYGDCGELTVNGGEQ
jgi:hypothetical protein